MENTKPWWQSKTLWGAVVTLASAGLGLAGLDLSAGDRETLTTLLTSSGAALGGLIAIFGRLSASRKIGRF